MTTVEYLLLAYLAYAIFIIRFYKRLVAKLSYIDEIDISKLPEIYLPFARMDKKNWNMMEIYFGAVFLLPIRLVFIGLVLFPCYLILILGSFGVALK